MLQFEKGMAVTVMVTGITKEGFNLLIHGINKTGFMTASDASINAHKRNINTFKIGDVFPAVVISVNNKGIVKISVRELQKIKQRKEANQRIEQQEAALRKKFIENLRVEEAAKQDAEQAERHKKQEQEQQALLDAQAQQKISAQKKNGRVLAIAAASIVIVLSVIALVKFKTEKPNMRPRNIAINGGVVLYHVDAEGNEHTEFVKMSPGGKTMYRLPGRKEVHMVEPSNGDDMAADQYRNINGYIFEKFAEINRGGTFVIEQKQR